MMRFSARYYDGQSSRATEVEVVLDGDVVRLEGLGVPVAFPLRQVRIAPRLGNTARSLALPGGAKCETSDNTAVDALEQRAGKGRASALLHRLESSWKGVLAAAALLALVVAGGLKWGIPLLARHVAESIPDALAYDLGQGTLSVLDRTLLSPTQISEQRQAELRAAFAAMASDYPGLPLELYFRRGIGPNAFALPDGTVLVTDELVELARSDEQILAVLAHEMGHVRHRHGLRMALESSTVALLFAAYLGDATQLTTLSASLPAVYAEAHYSREHETEADDFALDYLSRHGIAPHHFADILRALQAEYGAEPEGTLKYLSSHPPTAERLGRFEAKVP
ncbi:MAG TPA: M48 family metallopeptidase [Polyangiaceae bacterium]